MNSQNIKDVEKKGIGFISGVAIKPGTQVFPLTSRDVFYSENIVLTHTDRFVLSQYGAMRIWLTCIGANYTGADVLTVRFYRAEGDVGATRMAIVKDVAVTLPNVNNGYSGYVNVPDTTGILADCTHFSIDGTITRPSNATIKAIVTACASDSTEVEIINSGAIATEDENSDDILTAVEKLAEDNFEDDITAVETWLELPENIKGVSFILDCTDNTEATLEYTLDRSASPAHSVESELGTLVNDIESGYLAGAVAQVRMDDVVTNEVVAVPTVTKITFATAVPTTGDTVVFGDETYEFTTDSTTELTDPANIRIDMDALSITDETTAAQGFKTVFNANTAYDVAATGDAAAITLTASDNFEDYNDLATTTSITATATATYEDTTFGGGTGDSTTGVDAVAATLPKLWIIGIK